MRDQYAVQKMIAFVALGLVYMAGIIVALAVSHSGDVTAMVAIVGAFVFGGLAFGVGVIE